MDFRERLKNTNMQKKKVFMKANGTSKQMCVMAKESIFLEEDQFMKDTGRTIWPMVRVDSFIVISIFTKAIGKMTCKKDMELTNTLMAHITRVSGRMTNSTVKVMRPGLINLTTSASMSWARSKAKASCLGSMEATTRERLMLTIFKEKGYYKWADGRTYEGEWFENKMHGKGVFTWADGRKYDGEYKDDKKEGFGVMTWEDGRKYEGQWKNNKKDGEGTETNAEGKAKTGVWKDGKRVKK